MEILLVDDHELFLDGIRYILYQLDSNVIVHTEKDAKGARRHFDASHHYDLILLDMDIGEDSGSDLVKEFAEQGVLTPVVIVSATENISKIQSALDNGALGFIPKSFSGDKLLRAIKTVLDGYHFVEEQTQVQLKRLAEKKKEMLDSLTKKQLHVLGHLQAGLSNKQIADKMFLTENTVKSHLMAIFQKLDVQNRTECVLKVQRLNLEEFS